MSNSLYAFRVRALPLPQPPTLAIPDDGSVEAIRTRRAHTKSRRGCSLCATKDVECTYKNAGQPRRLHKNAPVRDTLSLQRFLWPGPPSPAVLTTKSSEISYTKYDLYLIDHFVKRAARYFELPEMPGIYSVQALDLAKQYPYLMHAMIAIAACHLQHVGIDARCYRLPEAFHCQMATRGLRNAIVSINGAKESDAVLTTSMLLNPLAFCVADYREDEVVTTEGPQWDWLRIQIGITDLLYRTKPFHPESMWLPMFISQHQIRITEPPKNDLDIRLAAFCNITPDSTCQNNPYFDFWEQLAPVVTRTPGLQYIRLYINAVGGIDHRLIGLLEARDERALVLFAHWAGMMCRIDSWWTEKRVTRACWAVCEILDGVLVGSDRELLERPAEACGFAFRV